MTDDPMTHLSQPFVPDCDRCGASRPDVARRQLTAQGAWLCKPCLEQVCGMRCLFCGKATGAIQVFEDEENPRTVISSHWECWGEAT